MHSHFLAALCLHFQEEVLSHIAVQNSAGLVPQMAIVDMVWPDQANHHGTLFGGAALSMLDRIAFIMGSKSLRGSVVTGAVSRLDFSAPAPSGHLVECQAHIIRRGNRSVTIETRLIAEGLLDGCRTECLSGEFVMVRQNREASQLHFSGADDLPCQISPALEPLQLAKAMVAEIVFPGHANHRGLLHGGPAMEWMTKAGFVAATRQVRKTVVMASSEKMDFKAPAYVGDIVEVTAQTLRTGTRSIDVQVDMWAESPESGERRHCSAAKFVYVAVKD